MDNSPILTSIAWLSGFSVFGSRMRDYESDSPFTIRNDQAVIQVAACIDKQENPFNLNSGASSVPAVRE